MRAAHINVVGARRDARLDEPRAVQREWTGRRDHDAGACRQGAQRLTVSCICDDERRVPTTRCQRSSRDDLIARPAQPLHAATGKTHADAAPTGEVPRDQPACEARRAVDDHVVLTHFSRPTCMQLVTQLLRAELLKLEHRAPRVAPAARPHPYRIVRMYSTVQLLTVLTHTVLIDD